jgi:hypothetical protein
MNFTSPVKKIFVKWPVLLVLLAVPAIVGAQTTKKTTTTPPPPPPKQSAPAPAAKPAAPQTQQPRGGTTTPPQKSTQPTPQGGVTQNPGRGNQNQNQNQGRSNQSQNQNQGRVNPTGQPNHGVNTFQTHNGPANVSRGAGGRTQTISTRNATIVRTPNGRVIETHLSNGARVVSTSRGRGFVERPLVSRPGYVQRTYVVGGRNSVRIYRGGYMYHGIAYNRYIPGYYYRPGFYAWAYNPWLSPAYYAWGWGAAPWFYDGYFAPAPFYPTASLWLTDYLVAADLQAAYDAQQGGDGAVTQSAPPAAGGSADANAYNSSAVSPAMRQAIADEVQRQLDAERAAAANPQQGKAAPAGDQAPPALDPDGRVFVVSTSLQVNDANTPCSLTPGDIISRVDDTPGSDNAVGVSVLTSKKSDCRPGSQPRVMVSDLQEMQNDMHAQLDEGLQTLAKNQGTNGLPPAPDAVAVPNAAGQGVADNAAGQIQQQQADADQTEKEVKAAGQGASNEQPEDSNPAPVAAPAVPTAAVTPANPAVPEASSMDITKATTPTQTIKKGLVRLFAKQQ